MEAVIRRYNIPPELPPDKAELLGTALKALPQKQRMLANLTPLAAAAEKVRVSKAHVELRYAVPAKQDLYTLIKADLPSDDTLQGWATQLCEAFMAAYPAGQAPRLRHGGLCGWNVVVDEGGGLRILDFGVAECFAEILPAADESWVKQVAPGVAPEVWQTPARFDQRSDLFSVGVLIYELSCGQHPCGAIRDDPEDCKYQMLIEVPVAPHRRNPDLDLQWSQAVYQAIRSVPSERYQTFAEMSRALGACGTTRRMKGSQEQIEAASPAAKPARRDPQEPPSGVAGDAPGDDESQARRQYLLEQARLKEASKEAEQRLAEKRRRQQQQREKRRAQLQRTGATIKKNALTLVAVLLGMAGVGLCGTVLWIRTSNTRLIERTLTNLTQEINQAFTTRDSARLAGLLRIEAPPRLLSAALIDLHKVAPDSAFRFADPDYEDLWRSRANTRLSAAAEIEAQVAVRVDQRSPSGVQLELQEPAFTNVVTAAVQQLARAQLSEPVGELARQLQAVFNQATVVREAQAKIALMLPQLDRPDSASPRAQALGYLGYRADLTRLQMGALQPVPGEQALEAEVILTDPSQQEIILDGVVLRFWYRLADPPGPCTLQRTTLQPAEQPPQHILWCMNATTAQVSAAFAAGDAAGLYSLIPGDRQADISATLDWAAQCKSARLAFEPPDLNRHTVLAGVSYRPGVINDREFEAGSLVFAFDPHNEWRLEPAAPNRWPPKPAALIRQEQSTPLLQAFREACQNRDAGAYLELFPGSHLAADTINEMFAKMERDQVHCEVSIAEDEKDAERLTVVILPQVAEAAAAAEYQTKHHVFTLQEGRLTWNGSSDPVWRFEGLCYQLLMRQISESNWNTLPEVVQAFQRGDCDMTGTERRHIQGWIQALDAARETFRPASERYVAGLPHRVLWERADHEPLPLRLVLMAGESPYYLYIMEREVRASDIERQWVRPEKPWDLWQSIMGQPPPAGQAVGLTLAEAQTIAEQLDCRLPTSQEWRAAAAQFDEVPDTQTEWAFYGGVWELCSPTEAEPQPVLMGGSWLHYDPQLSDAGVSTDPGSGQLADSGRLADAGRLAGGEVSFGTVGFRLCQQIEVPSAVVRALARREQIPQEP